MVSRLVLEESRSLSAKRLSTGLGTRHPRTEGWRDGEIGSSERECASGQRYTRPPLRLRLSTSPGWRDESGFASVSNVFTLYCWSFQGTATVHKSNASVTRVSGKWLFVADFGVNLETLYMTQPRISRVAVEFR
eukprot:2352631-Rhodomonas_salina.1